MDIQRANDGIGTPIPWPVWNFLRRQFGVEELVKVLPRSVVLIHPSGAVGIVIFNSLMDMANFPNIENNAESRGMFCSISRVAFDVS